MSASRAVVVWAYLAFLATPGVATALDGKEILAHLRQRDELVQNLHMEAAYQDLEEGKLSRWEEQTSYRDDLGRIRIITESGAYDTEGAPTRPPKQARTNAIYDGEKTVVARLHTGLDNKGQVVDGAEYRAAQVFDTSKSSPWNLAKRRNPFADSTNRVVMGLEEALVDGRPVSVERVDTAGNAYRVSYSEFYGEELLHCLAVIDGDRDWVVTQVDLFDDEQHLVRTAKYDYQEEEGNWVPTRGSDRFLGERNADAVPLRETRFTADVVRVNDPAFDESVFDVVLEAGTAVQDTRYQVSYQVGTEGAIGDNLYALAQEAKRSSAMRGFRPGTAASMEPRSRRWLWFALASVAMIVAVVVVVVHLRKQPQLRPSEEAPHDS